MGCGTLVNFNSKLAEIFFGTLGGNSAVHKNDHKRPFKRCLSAHTRGWQVINRMHAHCVLCAYNWAYMHVGFRYEQDMWRILMKITLFLFKFTQNHAPDPCYRTSFPGISGRVYLNTSMLHIERSICTWYTDTPWLCAISWSCTQPRGPCELHKCATKRTAFDGKRVTLANTSGLA